MEANKDVSSTSNDPKPLYGLIAEYDNVDAIVAASRKVRDAGYTKWDTHSPFPIHGIDQAMGIRMTGLPWIVLCCGLTGCLTAFLLQWWTNGVDYPFLISGKPLLGLPAMIPIMFELTILFSAFGAFFGSMALNNLPLLHHPLFEHPSFKRVTDDRFFLAIESSDPKFGLESTKGLLAGTGATVDVEAVYGTGESAALPGWMKNVAMVMPLVLLIPLGQIVIARNTTSPTTRLQITPDMDQQAKLKNQTENAFFADGRNARPRVAGTIPRGGLREDLHYFEGKTGPGPADFAADFPEQIEVNEALIHRGRQRYEITCAVCHGERGLGDGMVYQRAQEKRYAGFIQPTSVTAENVLTQNVGQIFNSVRNGIRTMPAYGSQVSVEDTWAIVAYFKALQKSQAFPVDQLTDEERRKVQQD